jgi:hypothetical protein
VINFQADFHAATDEQRAGGERRQQAARRASRLTAIASFTKTRAMNCRAARFQDADLPRALRRRRVRRQQND